MSGQWSTPWAGGGQAAVPPRGAEPREYGGYDEYGPHDGHDDEPRRRRWPLFAVLAAVLVLVGVVAAQLLRPVPAPTLELALPASHTFAGGAPVLPLPADGQAAVYVEGLGTMGSSGGTAPTPTASVAKVMTAYVYLQEHPLATGEAGPVKTVSQQGVAEMPGRRQRGESLLGITAGLRLSERKALEALLMISANDVAHELARWDAGTDEAFVAKMNAAARRLGMTSTTYTDPSGYDAGTVSTAADQVKLLSAAMRVPAFAEVVANRAYVPDDGGPARPSGNLLIGRYGVVGGKTGYTDKAGGNYVFAARKRVGAVTTTIIGAVMGQHSPSAVGAIQVGQRLVAAAETALTAERVAKAGDTVARVDDGLGGTTPLRAASSVTVVGWRGLTVRLGVAGDPPRTAAAGRSVGTLTAGPGRFALTTADALTGPSLPHRLLRLG
ncbi:D-alanyl-D-alanine carboxypeptidase family protein [Actinomadura atramentaria]|uniref:D-alanyl-D-alanine carboxypeptidase family protein n=1 Tax=Actinomadura atramentaria TaxID=1990 RepID=UPI00037A0DFB|nr:D-alanyl-D-alanine carboxypeptidase [Actinomadura atramentaria]